MRKSCNFSIQMRSHNEFLPSNWSEPLKLPLDDKCEGFKTNATNTPEKGNPHLEQIILP